MFAVLRYRTVTLILVMVDVFGSVADPIIVGWVWMEFMEF